jgi:preprotein translocase subunit YajC
MNLDSLHAILADAAPAAPAAPAPGGNPGDMLRSLIMIGGMIIIFYLLIIRPQSKKTKELNARLALIKPGDKIVTSSGIVGTVVAIKDRTISLRSAETKLEILKSAVADITPDSGDSSAGQN